MDNLFFQPATFEMAVEAAPGRFPFPGRVAKGGNLNNRADKQDQPADEHDQGKDKPPSYAPELIIRAFAGDAGARPTPATATIWLSPDIWLVSPNDDATPVAGQTNHVFVHVWNRGLSPCYGATLELYWCNPSVGVNMAGSNMIGMQANLVFQADEHRVFEFDWVPPFVNDGHVCLIAQAYDPFSDNLVAPFNPVQDRHVGQHNLNVIQAAAGSQLKLVFLAPNLSQLGARPTLRVQALQGAGLARLAQVMGRETLFPGSAGAAQFTRTELRPAHTTIDVIAHPAAAVFRETAEPLPQRLVRMLQAGALAAVPAAAMPKAGEKVRVAQPHPAVAERRGMGVASHINDRVRATQLVTDLPPGHEMAITLTVDIPAHALPGTHIAYQVTEDSGGRFTGGVTYVIEVV